MSRPSKAQYRCAFCGLAFTSRAQLNIHRVRYHRLMFGGGDLQSPPFDPNANPFEEFPDGEEMEEIYRANEEYILHNHQLEDEAVLIFNYPVAGHATQDDVESQMRQIYEHESTSKAYKLELSAGVILRHSIDGTLRYFKPESNVYILDHPLLIADKETLDASVNHMRAINIDEMIRNFRPDTKWVVTYITQLEWHVWPTNFPLGGKRKNASALPPHIHNSHYIVTDFDYADFENTCLLVALSQHRNVGIDHRRHRTRVRALLHQWYLYCRTANIAGYSTSDPKLFPGVDWNDLAHFEDCFKVNVTILELMPDKVAHTRFTSTARYDDSLHVNVYENHLSLISDIERYTQRYRCAHCCRMFRQHWLLVRHQKTCSRKSNLIFPTGAYRYHKSLFDQLREVGIHVPSEDQYFDQVICFDLESILAPMDEVTPSGKTTYFRVHKPISCSIASNVNQFTEPHCIVDKDPQSLVRKMFIHFDKIREQIKRQSLDKWGKYLDQLKEKLDVRKSALYAQFSQNNSSQPPLHKRAEPSAVSEAADDFASRMKKYYMSDPLFNQYLRLYRQFHLYMFRVIILSFNGGRYDLPLLSSSLIKYLLDREKESPPETGDNLVYESEEEFVAMYGGDGAPDSDEDAHELDDLAIARFIDVMKLTEMGKMRVIKRSNSYVCISNNYYSFLDACNFLPANCNYQSFVRAYASEGEKLFFPYEYLDDYSKLDGPLPPYPSEAWCSELKGGIDMLDEEFQQYLRDPRGGDKPKSGQENYDDIVRMWNEQNFTCLRHLLIAYNNADCGPFISAIVNMQNEYFAQSLDIWKLSVSCPGIARIKMMKYAQSQNILLPLFNRGDEDLFWLFKAGTVGGPSIIFCRYASVGETYLKPDGEYLCNSIKGYDCNALYCGCFQAPMPTFMYVRRHEEDGFVPHYRPQFYKMYIWLRYREQLDGRRIRTKMSEGVDIRAGKYYLDGLGVGDNGRLVAYELLGCFIHGHGCSLCKKGRHEDRYRAWLDKKAYLEKLQYEIIYIWECEMLSLMQRRPELKTQMRQMKPQFLQAHPKEVTTEQILSSIRDESLFGFVVCDIEVPLELRPSMNAFPPLFANHDVTMDQLSPLMRDYAISHNIKVESRRLLLSGMAAAEILLSSRLVAYYLKLGLVVTRVYQVIEYVKRSPFAPFVNDVTRQRKMAAKNPDRKIVGEIYKLMGIYSLFFLLIITIIIIMT